jgi:signal transduction histidine kinase
MNHLLTTNLKYSFLIRYGGAVFFVFVATIINILIWTLIKPRESYMFMGAVIVSTWWGGFRVGVFSIILSIIAIDLVFISPTFEFTFFDGNFLRLCLFSVQGLLFCWLIDKNYQISEENRLAKENLQSLSVHQQNLLEAERKRIALEIHDELGQALTTMKMDVHQLKQLSDSSFKSNVKADFSGKYTNLLSLIDSTVSKIRQIATNLRPPILDDFGTIAAIEWQAEEFEKTTGISCVVNSNVEDCELSPETSIAVFRIFQETLTNIARHSQANIVEINVDVKPNEIILKVFDNGKGIEVENIKSNKSLGILGMNERTRLIGGKLQILREKKGGTTVELTIPNNKNINDK